MHAAASSQPMAIARRLGLWSAVALAVAAPAGCSGAKCENQAFYGLPSPDSAYIAFVYHRRCTSPASIGTEVSIVPFHDPLRAAPGNVLSVPDEQAVKVTWRGPRILAVTGFKDPTLQRTQPLGAIAIEYP